MYIHKIFCISNKILYDIWGKSLLSYSVHQFFSDNYVPFNLRKYRPFETNIEFQSWRWQGFLAMIVAISQVRISWRGFNSEPKLLLSCPGMMRGCVSILDVWASCLDGTKPPISSWVFQKCLRMPCHLFYIQMVSFARRDITKPKPTIFYAPFLLLPDIGPIKPALVTSNPDQSAQL